MQRLTKLDGLRGVLAMYVMLGHAMPFAQVPGWVAAPFAHGEAAVDLFFALSGLVIVNSLAHYRYRFWPFMAARGRRLLPVYFAVLGLATVLVQCGSPLAVMPWIAHRQAALQTWAMLPPAPLWAHLAVHVVLAQGLIPQGVLPYVWISLLGPAWSLSAEWQFYLVIASVGARLRAAALGLLVVAVVYQLLAPHLPPFWQMSRAFLPDAAPFFALGLATSVWLRGGGVWLLAVAVAVVVLLGLAGPERLRALIPLCWVALMLLQKYPQLRLGGLLDSQVMQFLGAVSYPLYLLNEPVQRGLALLLAPLAHGDAGWFTLVWLPLAVTLPVGAAALVHFGLERPAMRWRPAPAR